MPTISGWAYGEPVPSADINAYLLRGNRNAIINGDMRINQRGATSATDDTYCLDRWTLLSDAATINTVQSAVAPSDGKYSMALTPSTINKKFGIIQFVENLNCVGMFGQMVTLSFKAKVSTTTNLSNIKAGVLSWSGTADTLTSDVISAWGASGTIPTLISGWTFENTPSNLGVTTAWATYRVQGVIDTAAAANVAAFIWCDTTSATGSDTLYVTDVQLEIGAIATPFERRSVGEELARCQRYYYRLTNSPTGVFSDLVGSASVGIGGVGIVYMQFPVTMRARPTAIEQSTYTDFNWYKANDGTLNSLGLITFNRTSINNGAINAYTSAATAGSVGHLIGTTAGGYLAFSAEL